MEFYININPTNPQELKEYLYVLKDKGLLKDAEIEECQDSNPVQEEMNFEQIKDKAVYLSQQGFASQIKALLPKYGTNKLSDLQYGDYFEFYRDLEGIENAD